MQLLLKLLRIHPLGSMNPLYFGHSINIPLAPPSGKSVTFPQKTWVYLIEKEADFQLICWAQ